MTTYTINGTAALAGSVFANTAGASGEQDAIEFYVTAPCRATAIRFFRLDTTIAGTVQGRIWQVATATTGTAVPGTDVTFTLSGTGWQTATLATPVPLTVNQRYRVAIMWGTNRFASTSSAYWTTGPGANGVTNGPLVVPNAANGTGGKTAWGVVAAAWTYPNVTLDYNYSCDVTVDDHPFTAALYPTTVASTVGTTWASTASATGSTTGTYATFTNTTSGGAGTIQLSGYGAQAAVSAGSSVDSVDVTVANHVGTTSRTASITVQLYSGTTAIGSPTALTISATTTNSQTVNLSGANAPTWAQLSDLRAQVTFTRTATTSANVFSLDVVGIVVNYTTGLVASTGAGVTTSTVATGALTTATALTPAVGDVVVVKASSGANQLEPTGVPTASAGGITFTQALAANTASSTATPLYIWAGTVTTAAAFTVSLPYQLTANFTVSLAMTVEVVRGVTLPATPNATATTTGDTTAPFTNTLTTATPNSLVSWVAGDYSGTYNSSAPPTVTPYAGGITYDFFSSTANVLDHYSGVQSAPTPGAQTYGYTAPTSAAQSVTYAAIELPATGTHPNLSTLVTDFSAVPSFFDGNFGGAFIDGNNQGETPTINAYAAFKTAELYNLAGDSVYCQVVTASGVTGSQQNSIKCIIDANNSVEMMLDGGTFHGRVQVAGTNTDVTLATYNATTHAWWRIREAAGTVYWDTAPDGTTWTNRGSAVHGLTLTAVQLSLQAGHWNAADPDGVNAVYDNLNIVPIVWSGDFTQADVVAAGFQDDNWNRDDGTGAAGTMPWPMPIAVAPDGIRSAQVTLPSGGKRDEIVEGHRDFAAGDNLWCGSSFYLPTGFDTTASAGSQFQVIEQLRQADDTGSPVAAFEVRNGNLLLTGGYGVLGASPASQYQYSQTLVTGITTGVRHYMTYRVGPFSTTAGVATIDVYVDGTHVLTNFTIPPPSLIGGGTYHKQGWYRDPANTYAGTLYIGHSKVGATQAAVDSTPSGTAYSQTVTDAAGAVDAATPATTYARAIADTAGAADAASQTSSYTRTVADTAGAVDAVTIVVSYAPTIADTAGAVDAVTVVVSYAPTIADTAGAVDAATSAATYSDVLADAAGAADAAQVASADAATVGDTAAVSDAVTSTSSATSSVADGAPVVDAVSAVLGYGALLADTAGAADAVASTASYIQSAADAAGAADAVQVAAADAVQVADTEPVTDAVTTTATYAQSPADAAAAVDAVSPAVAKPVTDTAPVADAATAAGTYLPGAADSAPAGDATSVALGYGQTPTDAAGAADAVTTTASYSLTVADTAGAADTAQVSGAGGAQVVDAAPVTDAADTVADYSRGLADVAGVSDGVTVAIVTTLADTAGAADAASSTATYGQTVADAAGAADIAQVSGAGVTQIADGAPVSDDLASAADYTVTLADTAGAVDAATAGIDYVVTAGDSVTAADAAGGSADYAPGVADGADVGDDIVVVAAGALQASVTDSADVTDAVMVSVAAVQVLADAAAVVDAVDVEQSFGDSSVTLADSAGVDDDAAAFVAAGQPGAFFAFLGGLM